MQNHIDQEFLDPNWPIDDPNYNIYETYGFSKLSEEAILRMIRQKIIAVPGEPDIKNIRLISSNFSVVYDYQFGAWIEQREVKSKKCSRGSSSSQDESSHHQNKPSLQRRKSMATYLGDSYTTSSSNQKLIKTRHQSLNSKNRPIDASLQKIPIITDQKKIQEYTNNKWKYELEKNPEPFKETCKSINIFKTSHKCKECDGSGNKSCNICNSSGFMTCPQCRGVGYGKRIMGNMGSRSTHCKISGASGTSTCVRCHGKKKVPCTSCGASCGDYANSQNNGNGKCHKCQGIGETYTDYFLKCAWINHNDRIFVGQHTKSLSMQCVSASYGIEVQDWSDEAIPPSICPDRLDLCNLSATNCDRLSALIPGKIRAEKHKMRAIPLCMATCEVTLLPSDNNNNPSLYYQNFYLLGTINIQVSHGKKVFINFDQNDGVKQQRGWSRVKNKFGIV